jgi:hypothetical protein
MATATRRNPRQKPSAETLGRNILSPQHPQA